LTKRDEIQQRLCRLERQNRQLVWGLATAIGLLGAIIVSSLPTRTAEAQPSRVLTAERFVVQDSNGGVRAVLGLDDSGAAQLTLLGGPDALRPGGTSGAVTAYVDRIQARLRVSMGQDPASPGVVPTTMGGGPGHLVVFDELGEPTFQAP